MKRYLIRLGVADLSTIRGFGDVERQVAKVFVHPNHRNAYFDVGVAVAGSNANRARSKKICTI